MNYLDAAKKSLRCAESAYSQHPYAHCALLNALEFHLYLPELIVVRGETKAMHDWQQIARQQYKPGRMVFAMPDSEMELPGLLAERKASGDVIAYRCSGMSCQAPVTDLELFSSSLGY